MYVVLYYHSIKNIDKNGFISNIELIKKYSEIIPLDINNFNDNSQYHVGISFDDGFKSLLDFAIPHLLMNNIPFTIFIPTAFIGARAGWINDVTHTNFEEIILNKEDIKALSRNTIVTIASHSCSHKNFKCINDSDAYSELYNSKNILEDITGKEICLFSFPYGEYLNNHINIAKIIGYTRVFNIDSNLAYNKSNEFNVSRVSVEERDRKLAIFLKITGSYRWMTYYDKYKKLLNKQIMLSWC